MLYAIHRGSVEGYQGGQGDILHLVASAEQVARAGHPFVFTDGHAEMRLSAFFEGLEDIVRIDWPIMRERYWHDTDEDGDRTRRRQAEFLVHGFFPFTLVTEIGVKAPGMARRVQEALGSAAHRPVVSIRPDWYY